MARLDPWGALFAFVAAAALTVASGGAAGFFTFAAFKVGATAAGLTLLAGLFAPRPDDPGAQRGGFIQSAVSAARYVYGERNPPMQLVAVLDRTNEDGDAFRGMVGVISEGPIEGLQDSIKIDGERVEITRGATQVDGGLRYRVVGDQADFIDLILYNQADGTQGQAIRDFSDRKLFLESSRTAAVKPSDLAGGDAPSPSDPFVRQSASTAKPAGDAPSALMLNVGRVVVNDDRNPEEFYLNLYIESEDPDLAGVQISVVDPGQSGALHWVDSNFPPHQQTWTGRVYRETRPGGAAELELHRSNNYRVDVRAWRMNGAVRVYGPSTGESLQGTTGGGQPVPGNDLNSTNNLTWTTRHKLTGLSYLFIRLRQPRDENHWRHTPQVQIPVKGRKITWPGQAVATYTRNAVAIVYDILRQMNYSADEIHEATFNAEHAHAGETLPRLTEEEKANLRRRGYGEYASGGAHIRYGADLIVGADDSMENVFSQLKTVMGEGWIYAWKNQWRIETGREKPVRRFTSGPARITDDDLVSFEYQPAHRLSERFNGIRFEIEQSAAHEWEPGSIEYIDETARRDRDFGLELPKNIGRLTALSDPVQAQRLCPTILERGRNSGLANVTVRPTDDLRWLDLEPNDIVEFEEGVVASYTQNLRFKGRVQSVAVQPDWSVSMVLLEERPIWSDSLLLPPWAQRVVASPLDIPQPVTGLTVDELAYRFDGTVYIFLSATWDAARDEGSIPVRLRSRLVTLPDGTAVANPEWLDPGQWGSPHILLSHAMIGATFEVQAQRGFPDGLVQSPDRWTPTTPVEHTVGGDLDPPAEPTGFTLTAVRGGYAVRWDDPPRTDGAVRWSVSDSDDAALVADANSNPPAGSRRGSTRGTYWFGPTSDEDEVRVWVRAFDESGNASDWVTATVTPLEGVAGADGEDGQGRERVFKVFATATAASADSGPDDGRVYDPASPTDGYTDGLTGLSEVSPYYVRWVRPVAGTPTIGDSPYESGTTFKEGWGPWVAEDPVHAWGVDGLPGDNGEPGRDGRWGFARSAGFATRVGTVAEADTRSEWHITGVVVDEWPASTVVTLGGLSAAEQAQFRTIENGGLVSITADLSGVVDRDNFGDYTVSALTVTNSGQGQLTLTRQESRGDVPAIGDGMLLLFTPAGADGEDGAIGQIAQSVAATALVGSGVTVSWTNPEEPADQWLTSVIVYRGSSGVRRLSGLIQQLADSAAAESDQETLISFPQSPAVEAGDVVDVAVAPARGVWPNIEVGAEVTAQAVATAPTIGVPVPVVTAGDSLLNVAWGEITGATSYEVWYGTINSPGTPQVTGITGLSTTLSGLTNGTRYWVRVRARSATAVSAWSSSFVSGTPFAPAPDPDPPGAPTVAAAATGPTSISVTWAPPSDNGGAAITGYQLRRSGSSTVTTLASTVLASTYTGLTAGTAYTVEVRARNSAGYGPWGSASVTTDAAPPAGPEWGDWESTTASPWVPELAAATDGDIDVSNALLEAEPVLIDWNKGGGPGASWDGGGLWSGASINGIICTKTVNVSGTLERIQVFQCYQTSANEMRWTEDDTYFATNVGYLWNGDANTRRHDDFDFVEAVYLLRTNTNLPNVGSVRAIGFLRWERDAGATDGSGTQWLACVPLGIGAYKIWRRRYEVPSP